MSKTYSSIIAVFLFTTLSISASSPTGIKDVISSLDGGENLFSNAYTKIKGKEHAFFGCYFGMTKRAYYEYMEKLEDDIIMSGRQPNSSCRIADGHKTIYSLVANIEDPMIMTANVWIDPKFTKDSIGYLIEQSVVFDKTVIWEDMQNALVKFCSNNIGKQTKEASKSDKGNIYYFERGTLLLKKEGSFRYGEGCKKSYGSIRMRPTSKTLERINARLEMD